MTKTETERSLGFARTVNLSAQELYRHWTDPKLVTQWFTPAPWKTPECDIDLRVGGRFRTVMAGPEGERFDSTGVFLEIVPNRKLVFTDAYKPGWIPNEKAFSTTTMEFLEQDGATTYSARVEHWTAEDCAAHKEMGFFEGWNKALDQLLELAGGG